MCMATFTSSYSVHLQLHHIWVSSELAANVVLVVYIIIVKQKVHVMTTVTLYSYKFAMRQELSFHPPNADQP